MTEHGNIKPVLLKWLENAQRIVVVGIGNELRKDDFAGMKIVENMRGMIPENVMLIESETVPENFIESILEFNPTHILLIDAGILGVKPGGTKFFESSKILGSPTAAISTHSLPLRIFCEYIERAIGAKIALLIIQPEVTDFGEGLSAEVSKAVEILEKSLLEILQKGLSKTK